MAEMVAHPTTWRALALACSFGLANCSHPQMGRSKLPIGYMDNPRADEVISGVYTVRGFAVVEDGIREVDIFVDREFSGSTLTGIERKDLIKPFPFTQNPAHGGWEYQLNSYSLLPGRHEVSVDAVSNGGTARTIGSVFVTINR